MKLGGTDPKTGRQRPVVIDEAKMCKIPKNKGGFHGVETLGHKTWVMVGIELSHEGCGRAETGRVFAVVIPDRKKTTFEQVLRPRLEAGSTVWTDCHPSYRWLKKEGFRHETVLHRAGEFSRVRGFARRAFQNHRNRNFQKARFRGRCGKANAMVPAMPASLVAPGVLQPPRPEILAPPAPCAPPRTRSPAQPPKGFGGAVLPKSVSKACAESKPHAPPNKSSGGLVVPKAWGAIRVSAPIAKKSASRVPSAAREREVPSPASPAPVRSDVPLGVRLRKKTKPKLQPVRLHGKQQTGVRISSNAAEGGISRIRRLMRGYATYRCSERFLFAHGVSRVFTLYHEYPCCIINIHRAS